MKTNLRVARLYWWTNHHWSSNRTFSSFSIIEFWTTSLEQEIWLNLFFCWKAFKNNLTGSASKKPAWGPKWPLAIQIARLKIAKPTVKSLWEPKLPCWVSMFKGKSPQETQQRKQEEKNDRHPAVFKPIAQRPRGVCSTSALYCNRWND